MSAELRSKSLWAPSLELAAREAAASAGAGITTDSVFYGLDSYKTHAQSAGGARKFGLKEFRGLFRGFLPVWPADPHPASLSSSLCTSR